MSRETIPLTISDLSQFAKALRAELPDPPKQLEMLGMVARAAGYRNYQHLRARAEPAPVVDEKRVTRALRYFDAEGRLAQWPARTAIQMLCCWVIWAQLPAREVMTERQISARIDALTGFRDAAQIRRSLIEAGALSRTTDGSEYIRVERPMPADARALLQRLRATIPAG
ncbi:DUF2087 domain-containing protein [Thalassococcus sp. BH17M4-6]|uniref:DUF2087 domain-containing protein n=1 Tax=Thalassococcus sp. BH17M4-6 TaxID=3413148 RepID=UPI003BD0C23D